MPPPNIELSAVQAVYFERDAGLMALLEDLPCAVVNRLAGGLSNNSKPYQALLVRQCGLLTPPTLVTNDEESALRFYHDCDCQVVYKSLSGIRSIVRRLEPEQLSRFAFLRDGPAQLQAFIPGENVRVHTVGDQLFATRVHTEGVDYRYACREGDTVVHTEGVDYRYVCRDGETVSMETTTLPPEVAASCRKLARQLGLLLTGIDLKETEEGAYYCFEVNPSPGFLYYEQHTRQPISTAVAELLHHGYASDGLLQEEDTYARNTFGTI
jgi:glutathione synthase/RimK-type ligase-like ATP-grasp enzyme